MLFSGELSMTSVEPLVGLLLPLPVVEEVPGAALVVELLEEQAASPAAMRPTAAIATVLLVNGLIVNFDCPLGEILCEGGFFFISGGCLLLLVTSGDIA
jgi:predicted acyltransferase